MDVLAMAAMCSFDDAPSDEICEAQGDRLTARLDALYLKHLSDGQSPADFQRMTIDLLTQALAIAKREMKL